MGREIKFRGIAASGTIVYGDLITQGYYAEVEFGLIGCGIQLKSGYIERIPDDKTVGQFTTYTDKHKAKIYEGDICRDRFGRIMQVIFWNGRLVWRCDDPKNNFKYADLWQWIDKGRGMSKNETILTVEIVGNIYETPELLKGGEGNG